MPLPLNWYHLNGQLADVSTSSSLRFLVPRSGFLRKVQTQLGGAITGSDSVVTVSRNGTNLAPTITVAVSSSAEGDVDSADFYQEVAAGDRIEVATGGQSTDTAELGITLTLSG
jgi:hypothetical protein